MDSSHPEFYHYYFLFLFTFLLICKTNDIGLSHNCHLFTFNTMLIIFVYYTNALVLLVQYCITV